MTYRDLDSDIDNLWSLLFTTGYLTQYGDGKEDGDATGLVIPNREIRWIFVEQIREWFKKEAARDGRKLEDFCRAFQDNNVSAIEEGFNAYLKKTISIRDASSQKEMKENFYHGILLGLFGHMDDWSIMSNAESGEGYSDIIVEVEDDFKFPMIGIKLRREPSLPGWEDFSEAWDIGYDEAFDAVREELGVKEPYTCSRLLSWPNVIQNSMAAECDMAIRGYYMGGRRDSVPMDARQQAKATALGNWRLRLTSQCC